MRAMLRNALPGLIAVAGLLALCLGAGAELIGPG
jgi:hypothetical protein